MSQNNHLRYYQPKLDFPKKELWEKFPQPDRLRCRELLVQLLKAATANPQPQGQSNERED